MSSENTTNKVVKNVEYGLEKIFEDAQDFLPLLGTDYVEFYVGNAKQAAHFYKTAFGFQSFAYAGLETGMKDRVSYVLKQDKIRLVLTTALHSDSPIGEHVKKHGDGVKVIALWVEDATKAFEETTKRGARPFMEPTIEEDENGQVTYFDLIVKKSLNEGVVPPTSILAQNSILSAPACWATKADSTLKQAISSFLFILLFLNFYMITCINQSVSRGIVNSIIKTTLHTIRTRFTIFIQCYKTYLNIF
jgi:uncharacterized glyoxalase superfamily protein PhnB